MSFRVVNWKELKVCVLLLLTIVMAEAAKKESSDTSSGEERMRQERLASKPWYLRNTEIFGFSIPASPITLLTIILSILNLVRGLYKKKSWAEASHILSANHAEETKKMLEEMKKDIDNDPMKFAKMAREYSSCPSKQQGGSLGKFKQGDMAPPFDRAVFDPQSPLEQTVGPIHTTFGWHLIFIHKRYLNSAN